MQEANRSVGADLLKFVASILVVGIHVTPEYHGGSLSEPAEMGGLLIQSLVRLGLPAFFVVSGFFLLNKPIPSYGAFYKTRLPKLIIPFLIYASLYVISDGLLNDFSAREWLQRLAEIIYGPTLLSGHFWFIGSMLGIYLLAPLLNAIFQGLTTAARGKACIALCALTIYQTFTPALFAGVAPVPPVTFPPLGVWLTYFLLGGFLGRIDATRYVKQAAIAFVLGYVMTVGFYYLRQTKQYNFLPHDAGINMVILSTSATYLLMAAGNEVRSRYLEKVIKFGAQHSFGVYLVHLLVMSHLGSQGFFDWMLSIDFYMVGLSILATYLISFAVSYIVDTAIVGPVMGMISTKPRWKTS